eukprot:CAMPEP_0196573142 /NCGR_PEP_ID=MMETSP1081-20130531/3090_1 /TAXON_ID=36882 /ORGANISM="Pyramimonas amylifera, Strain CCMP720" /LENGTH=436 /DNA_ID=CAMNT_0041890755 /DNA_START=124 /DNA_END=1434 /DNA_ORIENTATION=+
MALSMKSQIAVVCATTVGNRNSVPNALHRSAHIRSRPRQGCIRSSSSNNNFSSSQQSESDANANTLLSGVFPKQNEVYQVSTTTSTVRSPLTSAQTFVSENPVAVGVGAAIVAAGGIKYILDTPSRTYTSGNTVATEYDAWTEEGILEHYWGEHIHLGYYTEEERAAGYLKKDFIEAKKDFTYEMLKWSGAEGKDVKRILDCGCGIGGTSRILAQKFPNAQVTGITLSPNQVKRGTELAKDQGLSNVEFKVMDALNQEHADNTFDLVWACESGEHMPDKKKYVEEMVRVLAPGGTLAVATWCQRDQETTGPLTQEDKDNLQYLYDEWAHPYFISYEEYARMMDRTGVMESLATENWVKETINSWRHSTWVGVFSPWFVIMRPHVWYKTVRDIVCLERMHRAFDRGLMTYGMIKGTKKAVSSRSDKAEDLNVYNMEK